VAVRPEGANHCRMIDQNQTIFRPRGGRVLVEPADLDAVFVDAPVFGVRIGAASRRAHASVA
jgi:hypothetical protein